MSAGELIRRYWWIGALVAAGLLVAKHQTCGGCQDRGRQLADGIRQWIADRAA